MQYIKVFYLLLIIILSGCAVSISLEDIPIANIPDSELKKQLYTFALDEQKIQDIVENKELSTQEKIDTLAKEGTIRDIVILFYYLNNTGNKLLKDSSTLHSAKNIFNAKVDTKAKASMECMEGAMLAASILKRKNIQPFLLYMNGFNLSTGHTVCVYRTKKGWGTVGVNDSDFIEPTIYMDFFRKRLNERFRFASQNRALSRNIVLYSLREPEEVNADYINSDSISLSWSNLATFFRGRWY